MIFIFAGESSADLHGAELLKALYRNDPNLKIMGVAGPKMREVGMECIMPMEEFQVMGFIDVFLALPKLVRQFYQVRKAILTAQPKTVVFIDYPGFNLRMARSLRRKHFAGKLVQYICPSVWAWGKKRIPLMAENLDLLLTILPFEARYFANTPLKVIYVGHPLVKKIEHAQHRELSSLPKDKRIISLFSGSRTKEIERNLPLHLRVARKLSESHPDLCFVVSLAHPRFLPLIQKIMREENFEKILLVPQEETYSLMRSSHLAIAKSGTVTLELALHKVPTVVTYGITPLDLFIAQKLLRINLPYYCIVNIISDREVYPELIGPNLTEDNLYSAANKLLSDPFAYEACRQDCRMLTQLLENKESSEEAAKHILIL